MQGLYLGGGWWALGSVGDGVLVMNSLGQEASMAISEYHSRVARAEENKRGMIEAYLDRLRQMQAQPQMRAQPQPQMRAQPQP